MPDDRRTPVADALVDFVLGLELESLPEAVVAAAGLSFTDWVGAAIRGSTEPLAGALDAVVAATGGEPQATVLGRGRRTSALLAALANGAQGHALDFDDTQAMRASAATAQYARGRADEPNFIAPGELPIIITTEHGIVP